MDFSSLLSSVGIGGFDFKTILNNIYLFGAIFLLCLIIGVFAFIYYYISQRNKNKITFKIGWWEETTAGLVPTYMEDAEEIVIPGTALRVFYVEAKDKWLPRFTRGITKDLFYVCITPNGQMINFTLKKIEDSLKESGLQYDHTDMLWAAENTREFIKRNYKNKSIK